MENRISISVKDAHSTMMRNVFEIGNDRIITSGIDNFVKIWSSITLDCLWSKKFDSSLENQLQDA